MSGVAPYSGAATALYRATGLGRAFSEAIGEMWQAGQLTREQADQAMREFDQSFSAILSDQEKTGPKVQVSGALSHYRFCDGIWTLNLKNAQFEGAEGSIHAQHVKVVASEAKKQPKRAKTAQEQKTQ